MGLDLDEIHEKMQGELDTLDAKIATHRIAMADARKFINDLRERRVDLERMIRARHAKTRKTRKADAE